MKKYFFFILVLNISFCFGQKEKIILPVGNNVFKDSKKNFILNIRVDNTNKIYLNDSLLSLNNLGKIIRLKRIKSSTSDFPQIFLYAHKNVKYHIIDSVKSELAKALINRLIYRTSSDKKDSLEYGIAKRIHPAKNYSYFYDKYQKINDSIHSKNVNQEGSIEEFIPITQKTIEQNLYDLNFNILKKIKYTKVQLTNKNFLYIAGKKFKLKDHIKIGEELLRYSNLFMILERNSKYKHYIKSIESIKKAQLHLKKQRKYFRAMPEISIQLQDEMKKYKFII